MENRLTVNYEGKPCYDIVFTDSFSDLSKEISSLGFEKRKIAVITDTNVGKIYGDEVKKKLDEISDTVVIYEIPAGESNKQLSEITKIYEFLMERHFDRHDLIVALGGGVVGDMGGFCAATYLRGISFYTRLPVVTVFIGDCKKLCFDHSEKYILVGKHCF